MYPLYPSTLPEHTHPPPFVPNGPGISGMQLLPWGYFPYPAAHQLSPIPNAPNTPGNAASVMAPDTGGYPSHVHTEGEDATAGMQR